MKKRAGKTLRLETAFNRATTPVFLLDAHRRIQFFNSGCEELTGWSADEMIGQTCDYAGVADTGKVPSLTGSLAPPPDVEGGHEARVPTNIVCRDGSRKTRMLHFFPLTGENGKVRQIVGIAMPIREPPRPSDTPPARRLHAELAAHRQALRQRFGKGSLIGRCPAMLRVLEQIELAAVSHAGLFIRGEPGTGCEHVARLVHFAGELGSRAFVPLDCRRLPPSELKQTLRRLIEALAETGEARPVSGLQPGTVYLGNVEALPRDLQQMLVEAERSAETGSGDRLRYVASSTADIEQFVETETLLAEFYYLLTAIRIELPPLRERGDDLQLLAQAFLEELNRGDEKQVGGFCEEVWRQFGDYDWPGNLDELDQVIAEARTACAGQLVQAGDLPFRFRTGLEAQAVGPPVKPRTMPLADLLEKVEAEQIRAALEQTRYNKTKAAELLGIPRPRLYRRMEALGIADLEQ